MPSSRLRSRSRNYADKQESKDMANKRKHDIRADPSTRDAVHAQDAATRQKIKDDPFRHANQLAAQSACNLKVKERRKAEEKAAKEQENASNTSMPAEPSNSKRREKATLPLTNLAIMLPSAKHRVPHTSIGNDIA